MHIFVQKAYDFNSYNEIYRNGKSVTSFEKKILYKFLKSIDKNKPKVLDIGCGAGLPYDAFLVENNCILQGIDCSKKQVQHAKSNVPRANYVNSDFLKYSLVDSYDGVIMLYSLFHFHRAYHDEILNKIYNCLTENGKVLLNVRKENCGLLKFRRNFCGKPMLWSHYDYKTFKEIAQYAGFKCKYLGDEKDHGSAESHIWLILEKNTRKFETWYGS